MENIDVARVLGEIADLLDISGGNAFRIRAYRNAARTIETLGTPVGALLAKNPEALQDLPGIGADLAGKIATIARTGSLPLLETLSKQTPASLTALLHVQGIGPKRARLIHEALGVNTLRQLERAAKRGQIRALPGLGAATERAILAGVAQQAPGTRRTPLAEADAHVRPIVEALRAVRGVTDAVVAGSVRRRAETVGDVDVLVCASRGAPAADAFVTHPDVARVLAHGSTRCSVVLHSGLQADLRVVPRASFGAALHYFTGSKPHNIAVRRMGVKRHLKINEYGVFRGTRRVGGRTEKEVYAAVGLPWIAPELREDRGELDAARRGSLPHLVEVTDLRGDLQMHTDATDGVNTLREMAEACEAHGYEYIAITDHSKAVRVAGGLTRAGFRRQFREIERVQKTLGRLTILKGAEVDILEDGRLDLDDATLAELDVVVASVHSKLTMPKAAMTTRLLRALAHPRVHILGHPTGRLINRRAPIAVDLDAVIRGARDHGVLLEINAQPDRLDLRDVDAALAREAGVRLVVSTDAHRVAELDAIVYGVDQARRAWCTPGDIANTRSLAAFRKLLRS